VRDQSRKRVACTSCAGGTTGSISFSVEMIFSITMEKKKKRGRFYFFNAIGNSRKKGRFYFL